MKWSAYSAQALAKLDYKTFYSNEFKDATISGKDMRCRCFNSEAHRNNDSHASLYVDIYRGVYYCHTCGIKGNIITYLTTVLGMDHIDAWQHIAKLVEMPLHPSLQVLIPSIDERLIQQWSVCLLRDKPIELDKLLERGITLEVLRSSNIGYNGERVTIPVYDRFGSICNVRQHKWDASDYESKILNYTDEGGVVYSEVQLYNLEVCLNSNEVVWCEGELDALASTSNGIPAMCPTAGAGYWRNDFKMAIGGKKVYICQDNDDAGVTATNKLIQFMQNICQCYVIQWPSDFPEKGDISDWYRLGHTAEEFKTLMSDAPMCGNFMAIDAAAAAIEYDNISLEESAKAEYINKAISLEVKVIGKCSVPLQLPAEIRLLCNGDNNKTCSKCQMSVVGFTHDINITPSSPLFHKFVGMPDNKYLKLLTDYIGMPRCARLQYEILKYNTVEVIRFSPAIDTSGGLWMRSNYMIRDGYVIDHSIATNKQYTMYGYARPDPYNGNLSYAFSTFTATAAVIDSMVVDANMTSYLQKFVVAEGQTVEQKIAEIHADFERNVTQCWLRNDVSISFDLVMHTALNFYFQGKWVERGWGELVIIGDSAQGKSTLIKALMRHYKVGDVISGEASSRTGLVYTIHQSAKGMWYLIWGSLPENDRGAVVVDEFGGIPEETIAQMSDLRSSGIAKANGTVQGETYSRVRLIMLSNPRSGRPLHTEPFAGIDALRKLFGKSEDIRRVDLAMALATGDIPTDVINKRVKDIPQIPHVYTSDACQARAIWAWSRTADQIVITDEAEEEILKQAIQLGNEYSATIPLVEAADQRMKLARLSVGCASMLCSSDATFEKVIVKKEHVEFVANHMRKCYNSKGMKYDEYSAADKQKTRTDTSSFSELAAQFTREVRLPDYARLVAALNSMVLIDTLNVRNYTGLSQDEVVQLSSFLLAHSLVQPSGKGMYRTPVGSAFFKHLRDNLGTLKAPVGGGF